VLAATALAAQAASGEPRNVKRELADSIAQVAARLRNTVAICRKCYVHPSVIAAHAEGTLSAALERLLPATSADLATVEAAVLRLLEGS